LEAAYWITPAEQLEGAREQFVLQVCLERPQSNTPRQLGQSLPSGEQRDVSPLSTRSSTHRTPGIRGMFCDFLKRSVYSGELAIPPRLTAAKAVSLFNRLGRSDWNTRIQEKYDQGVSVAGYLARYVCGSPISGRRIERVSRGAVVFRYRDHRDGQQKVMRLKPHDFLNRWFEHVPPRGLRMIRRSGLYANCCAEDRARICEQLSETDSSEIHRQAANQVTNLDPERCPLCNTEVTVGVSWHPQGNEFSTPQTPIALVRPP